MAKTQSRAGVILAPRVLVEPDAVQAGVPLTYGPVDYRRSLTTAVVTRVPYVIAAFVLFVLSLKLLTNGASGATSLLDRLSADGPLNLFGFGWLGAYVALSGSPVAATSLGLFSGGAISDIESFAMINGSRFGASFIVLFVGFLYYVRHRRNPDGLYIGVVALLTTWTVYTPSMLIGLAALKHGWFDRVDVGSPPGLATVADDAFGETASWLAGPFPGLLVFVAAVAVLLLSFQLFDKILPNLDPPSPRLERVLSFFHRPLSMFVMGGLVTLATLSVAISLTLLVPLSMKGVVRRHGIVPYVMGANITTFIDTLFAAVLLDTPRAVTIVFTQLLMTTAVSLAVLLFVYRPYQRVILGVAHRATANRRAFAGFLSVILAVPALMLLV